MKQRLSFYILLAVAVTLWLPAMGRAASPSDAELARKLASLSQPAPPVTMTSGWVQRVAGDDPLHIILVEKDLQLLQVLEYDGVLKVVARFFCATGENIGKKLENGDARTPEGIYFINKEYVDNKVTIFGKRAFHLDYPNFFDRSEGLAGNGIYIHGTNKKLEPNSTNGCITLDNKDLNQLAGFLKQDETPVVVVQNRRSLMNVDSALIAVRPEAAGMLVLPESVDPTSVAVDMLYLINDGVQTVAFGKFAVNPGEAGAVQGFGRSYLTHSGASGWQSRDRIWTTRKAGVAPAAAKVAFLADQSLPVPESATAIAPALPEAVPFKPASQKAGPLPGEAAAVSASALAPESASRHPSDQQQVMDFLETWRLAWQTKQLDRYISCYDSAFTSEGKNLAAWRTHKDRLNQKYRNISVEISNVSIDFQADGAKVLFRQVYQSDDFRAEGKKALYLRHSDNRWRIHKEIWLN